MVGFVLRDAYDKVMVASNKKVTQYFLTVVATCMALDDGLKIAWEKGLEILK